MARNISKHPGRIQGWGVHLFVGRLPCPLESLPLEWQDIFGWLWETNAATVQCQIQNYLNPSYRVTDGHYNARIPGKLAPYEKDADPERPVCSIIQRRHLI